MTRDEDRNVLDELRRVYFSADADEQDVLRAIGPLLGNARFFVDIGASLGQFTQLAARTMRGGRILAVEADPVRAGELARACGNWQSESAARLDVVHAAATDRDGVAQLSITDSAVSGGLFRHPLEHLPSGAAARVRWREIEVPAKRLDTLCGGDMPDLVKIDVEGAELRVLKGADRILQRAATRFLVELHPWADPGGQSSSAEVIAFMVARGYRAFPFAGKTLFVGRIGLAESLILQARSLTGRLKARWRRNWSRAHGRATASGPRHQAPST